MPAVELIRLHSTQSARAGVARCVQAPDGKALSSEQANADERACLVEHQPGFGELAITLGADGAEMWIFEGAGCDWQHWQGAGARLRTSWAGPHKGVPEQPVATNRGRLVRQVSERQFGMQFMGEVDDSTAGFLVMMAKLTSRSPSRKAGKASPTFFTLSWAMPMEQPWQ